MKASVKWLKEYVPLGLSAADLAEKLTMAGLEVKAIASIGEQWQHIVVAEILSVAPHPNADRLRLVTVSTGMKTQTVVCGAPNLTIGDKIAFASVGARLTDGHTGEQVELKPAKIRGVTSEGMVCSEKELGMSGNHEGILVLSPDAPVGQSLAEYLGDAVLDLDVTPNRPDCMSVIGVAREVAALTGQSLKVPQPTYSEGTQRAESMASVEIVEPALCPRYCAIVVTGIKIGPSPRWMQERLASCDMRPINNIVDITNYVMMEYGQPLHAFDFRNLKGQRIVVRRAGTGESITSLDNVKRALTTDMLVIADAERPVAIAGVMGGLDTEVTDATTSILLESANFERGALRRASLSLGLRSEASVRFEKGLSTELPLPALQRATQLILEIAGGEAARGVLDVYPGKSQSQVITLSHSRVWKLLGVAIDIGEIKSSLTLLGFECKPLGSEELAVAVPYWRTDISGPADLAEEVARVIGYDRIPTTMLAAPIPTRRPAPAEATREKVRDLMVSVGFQEALTYSAVALDSLKAANLGWSPSDEPLRLANPMSRDQEYLRTSLRPGLLSALARNQRFDSGNIELFEIGKVFFPRKDDLPVERLHLCAVFNGGGAMPAWGQHARLADFYDAKGVVESLLSAICSDGGHFHTGDDAGLYPGRRADIYLADSNVGVVGELHPKVGEAFELVGTTFLMEIDLQRLIPLVGGMKRYQPFVRFPSMTRDIALVVDEGVTYAQVKDTMTRFPLVTQVALFDVYRGRQVPEGKKSFALRLIYQSPEQTLTEEQVSEVQNKILGMLEKNLGAVLRSQSA